MCKKAQESVTQHPVAPTDEHFCELQTGYLTHIVQLEIGGSELLCYHLRFLNERLDVLSAIRIIENSPISLCDLRQQDLFIIVEIIRDEIQKLLQELDLTCDSLSGFRKLWQQFNSLLVLLWEVKNDGQPVESSIHLLFFVSSVLCLMMDCCGNGIYEFEEQRMSMLEKYGVPLQLDATTANRLMNTFESAIISEAAALTNLKNAH
ncbi:MAG: hypothetical protein MI725_15585 [Pirellulales bacterium]|nr:hypothetical protein [Pirellulales bacterium]